MASAFPVASLGSLVFSPRVVRWILTSCPRLGQGRSHGARIMVGTGA
uniref:Uncharacterized protein n=1 Tax=Arundo donax TaxID=35708 RepID=A0A0A9D6C3_ARUDO